MSRFRIFSLLILIVSVALGYFIYLSEQPAEPLGRFSFQFGLDLKGGSELIYQADTSALATAAEVNDAMISLRQVIERRVNSRDFAGAFGVLEPTVRIEETGLPGLEARHRLTVELPGVTKIDEAKEFIGRTPTLEFKLLKESAPASSELEQPATELFSTVGLDGRLLNRARLEFDQVTGQPLVALSFNREGRELFATVTKENVGKILAIFLDGQPISLPVIREEIRDGNAQISGNFNLPEAKELVRNLNLGALPLPIELVGSQKIGPTLGAETVSVSFRAGLWGLLLVVLFMILWYRLPGLISVLSLSVYLLIMLSLFKLIPVTLTAAGLAGLILSIGMAVDANVLIFERLREELAAGRPAREALNEAFRRSWPSIRDANVSSLITALILFWFGSLLIQGFALVFGLGILVSMFSAIVVTRYLLLSVAGAWVTGRLKFIWGSGIKNS